MTADVLNMTADVLNITEEINVIKCEYCNTICKSKKTLHDHKKNSIKCIKLQGKEIKVLKCDNCENEYNGNEAYRRHINKCHEIEIKQGFIYKIIPIIHTNEHETYYGSTKECIDARYMKHKCLYKKYIINNIDYSYFYCSSFNLFEKYGLDNCEVKLVEKLYDTTKKKLLERERYYYDNMPNINQQKPQRSLDEDTEYYKKYRETHKEQIKERDTIYYNKNKEKILEQQKGKRDNMTENERELYLQNRKDTRDPKQESDTKSKMEKCEYCKKEIRHDHLKGHYNSNECKNARGDELVIYNCEKCKLKFKSISMLKKHKTNCEREDIEECEYCKEIIKTSIKKKHQNTEECIIKQPEEIRELKKENKVKCEYCNEIINQNDLSNHKQSAKCREKQPDNEVECQYCKKRVSKISLKTHYKSKKCQECQEIKTESKKDKCNKYAEDEEYRKMKLNQVKKYNSEHKEEKKEYLKKYHDEHKEEHNEKGRGYWNENKEKINEKRRKETIECEYCKEIINRAHKKQHERSEKCKESR
jgi:hypothetical protein